MRFPPLVALLCFNIVSLALAQDKGAEPQRFGDLLVELTGVSTPASQGTFELPSDRYWVVAKVNFRNIGKTAICTKIGGSLKGEYGLVARVSAVLNSLDTVATISELLPGEEADRSFIFTLKRGAAPLELSIDTVSYGGECGDRLPRSSVQFPIKGISSPPKNDNSGIDTAEPASKPPASENRLGSCAYRGGVSPPTVIYKVEPEYSEEAFKAKFQGTVVLFVVVDEKGVPCDLRVIRPLGLGLDQKAIAAVQQWRFKPGMKDGKPVPTQATIEVNFRLDTSRARH